MKKEINWNQIKDGLIDYIKNNQMEHPEKVDNWEEAITNIQSVIEDIEEYMETIQNIVPLPAFVVDEANIDFDMEVKNQ